MKPSLRDHLTILCALLTVFACGFGVQRRAPGEDGKREGGRGTQAHKGSARAARATSSEPHDGELQVVDTDGLEMVAGAMTVGQPTVLVLDRVT